MNKTLQAKTNVIIVYACMTTGKSHYSTRHNNVSGYKVIDSDLLIEHAVMQDRHVERSKVWEGWLLPTNNDYRTIVEKQVQENITQLEERNENIIVLTNLWHPDARYFIIRDKIDIDYYLKKRGDFVQFCQQPWFSNMSLETAIKEKYAKKVRKVFILNKNEFITSKILNIIIEDFESNKGG